MKTVRLGEDAEDMAEGSSAIKPGGGVEVTPELAWVCESVFRFLNPKDKDILLLVYFFGMKQKAVRKLLGKKQNTLSYDVKRLRERLQFICHIHNVYDIFYDFIRRRNSEFPAREMKILTLLFHTTSMAVSSHYMGGSQLCSKYWLDNALDRIVALEEWEVFEIIQNIKMNFGIIRRVEKGKV